ncbi:hypothetical protein NEIG_00224 [Nematocida sp. ERTm5]|nr:hypothetical protein NEIG_00224 [Nematocida sp. ERTm5]
MYGVFNKLVSAAYTAVEKIADFIAADVPEEKEESCFDAFSLTPGEYRGIYKNIHDIIEEGDGLEEEQIDKISSLLNTVVKEEDLAEYMDNMRFIKDLAQGKEVNQGRENEFIQYIAGKNKRKYEESDVDVNTNAEGDLVSSVKYVKPSEISIEHAGIAIDTGLEPMNITGFTAPDYDESVDWEAERKKELKRVDDVLALGLNPFNKFRDDDGVVKYPSIDSDAEIIQYDKERNVLRYSLRDDPRKDKYLPYYCIHPTENRIVKSIGIPPGAVPSLMKLQMKEKGFIKEDGRLERDQYHADKTDRWSRIIREQKEREKREQQRRLEEARKRFNEEYAERERLRLLQEEELKKVEQSKQKDPIREKMAKISEDIDRERAGKDYQMIHSKRKSPEAQKALNDLIYDAIRDTSKGIYEPHHHKNAMDLYNGSLETAKKTKLSESTSNLSNTASSNLEQTTPHVPQTGSAQTTEEKNTKTDNPSFTTKNPFDSPLESIKSDTGMTGLNKTEGITSNTAGMDSKSTTSLGNRSVLGGNNPFFSEADGLSPKTTEGTAMNSFKDTSKIGFGSGSAIGGTNLGSGLFGNSGNSSLFGSGDKSRNSFGGSSTQMDSSNIPSTDSINLPKETMDGLQQKSQSTSFSQSSLLGKSLSSNGNLGSQSLFGSASNTGSSMLFNKPGFDAVQKTPTNTEQEKTPASNSTLLGLGQGIKQDNQEGLNEKKESLGTGSPTNNPSKISMNDYTQSPLEAFQKRILRPSQSSDEALSQTQTGINSFTSPSTERPSMESNSFTSRSNNLLSPAEKTPEISRDHSEQNRLAEPIGQRQSSLFTGSSFKPNSLFGQNTGHSQSSLLGNLSDRSQEPTTGTSGFNTGIGSTINTPQSAMSSRFNSLTTPPTGDTQNSSPPTGEASSLLLSNSTTSSPMNMPSASAVQNPTRLTNTFSGSTSQMNAITNPFGGSTGNILENRQQLFSNPQGSSLFSNLSQQPTSNSNLFNNTGNNTPPQGTETPQPSIFSNNQDGNTEYVNPFAGKDTVRKRSSFMFKK